jgi:hypothetical protein
LPPEEISSSLLLVASESDDAVQTGRASGCESISEDVAPGINSWSESNDEEFSGFILFNKLNKRSSSLLEHIQDFLTEDMLGVFVLGEEEDEIASLS